MDSESAQISSSSPPVCLGLYVPSVMSQPKTQTFLLQSRQVGEKVLRQKVKILLVVSIRLHNQQSNDFQEEQQQQDAIWSGISSGVLIHCFSLWGPQ